MKPKESSDESFEQLEQQIRQRVGRNARLAMGIEILHVLARHKAMGEAAQVEAVIGYIERQAKGAGS